MQEKIEKNPFEDRYNPGIIDAQKVGPIIKLKEEEVNLLKNYIKSGKSVYQDSFGDVFVDTSTGECNLFITRNASFNGNILEYIDKYSNEIFHATGIRFCYLPRRHSPPSENIPYSGGLKVSQFILAPMSYSPWEAEKKL